MASLLWLAVGPWSLYKCDENYLQILKRLSFWLQSCCGWWEDCDPLNRFNHSSWVAVVTPTDRPNSVFNRCVIEGFGGVFVLFCHIAFWTLSVVRAFVIGLLQISSFFSFQMFYLLRQILFASFLLNTYEDSRELEWCTNISVPFWNQVFYALSSNGNRCAMIMIGTPL